MCVKPNPQTNIRPGATFYCSSVKHKHDRNMGKWQPMAFCLSHIFVFHSFNIVAKPFNRILKPNFDANVELFKHLNQPKSLFFASHQPTSPAKLGFEHARNAAAQLFCLTQTKQWPATSKNINFNGHKSTQQKSNEFQAHRERGYVYLNGREARERG